MVSTRNKNEKIKKREKQMKGSHQAKKLNPIYPPLLALNVCPVSLTPTPLYDRLCTQL